MTGEAKTPPQTGQDTARSRSDVATHAHAQPDTADTRTGFQRTNCHLLTRCRANVALQPRRFTIAPSDRRNGDHAIEVIENSRIEMVLPKHGPTDGADSIPE